MLDLGIEGFIKRNPNYLQETSVAETFKVRIEQLKKQLSPNNHKPLVVISGAGPAGLLRAIQSIINGNPTQVIEKRSQDNPGRENTVALTETSIKILQHFGIYAYLIENKLIYPPNKGGFICARIKDLEKAMKKVLEELSPQSVITYDSTIVAIDTSTDKIRLSTQSSTGEQLTIADVGIFVNAEGAKSSTNGLLNINREKVLPPTPALVAIFRDDRPDITNFAYIGITFAQFAITIYYHTIFLFQYLCSKNFNKQISGALVLPTPGQNYLGCVFSDMINERFIELCNRRNEQKYQAFAKYWINIGICFANMISFLSWFNGGPYLHTARNLPVDRFEIVDIGADCASKYSEMFNESAVLLVGDASATVDPTTGLGCNTAIQTSVYFVELLLDDYLLNPNSLAAYNKIISSKIKFAHDMSISARKQYKPNALQPIIILKTNPEIDVQAPKLSY